MENEVSFVWGYNGLGKVDKQAKKQRLFTSPLRHVGCKCKTRFPNSAPDGQGHGNANHLRCLFYSNLDKIISVKGIDDHHENPEEHLHMICQHDDTTYLISTNGLCNVIDQSHDAVEHSIVKGGAGKEKVKLKCVSAGDIHTVGITDTTIAGCITKETSSHIFRPFVPSVTCKQVSCGKEHVLLLSTHGQVYSYGYGSRGQLGHGVTDKQQHPKLIEAMEAVSIATVSAGGWHSAAVSDIHDLYIWGWNESGQLGFKMKNSSEVSKVKLDSSIDKNDSTSNPHKLSSSDSDIVKAVKGEQFHMHSQESELSNVQNVNFEMDKECVVFQLLPALLDLPNGQNVSKVSCGSRHSAAIADNGHLYTWGWGEYGQLGHGDRDTRDTPTLVQYFTNNHLTVTGVVCHDWNTAVSTQVRRPCQEQQIRT